MEFKNKYLKYKLKYLTLLNQIGGNIEQMYNNIIRELANYDKQIDHENKHPNKTLILHINDLLTFLKTPHNKSLKLKSDKLDKMINKLISYIKEIEEYIIIIAPFHENQYSEKMKNYINKCLNKDECIKEYTQKVETYKTLKRNLSILIGKLNNLKNKKNQKK
jgi:hypothetical protein